MIQATNDDDDDDDDDYIGNTLGKLSRALSRIREIFIETLNNLSEAVISSRGPCFSSMSKMHISPKKIDR